MKFGVVFFFGSSCDQGSICVPEQAPGRELVKENIAGVCNKGILITVHI